MNSSLNLTNDVNFLASSRVKKTISLTALIDVVFILLMFFMLTSTFIKWHSVTLQTSVAGSTITSDEVKTQLIILHENNEFSLLVNGGNATNKKEQKFSTLLTLTSQLAPNIHTVLIPEPQIKVQKIIDTLTQLKSAGIMQVTLGNVLNTQDNQ
ncbi:MAG: biopolymer transporter ExbD [Colwellia sp.]|nr:MAG: biopolymer transporter ExbD [Colwellia sp.]